MVPKVIESELLKFHEELSSDAIERTLLLIVGPKRSKVLWLSLVTV